MESGDAVLTRIRYEQLRYQQKPSRRERPHGVVHVSVHARAPPAAHGECDYLRPARSPQRIKASSHESMHRPSTGTIPESRRPSSKPSSVPPRHRAPALNEHKWGWQDGVRD